MQRLRNGCGGLDAGAGEATETGNPTVAVEAATGEVSRRPADGQGSLPRTPPPGTLAASSACASTCVECVLRQDHPQPPPRAVEFLVAKLRAADRRKNEDR
jgi:hypothetical protein